MKKTLLAALCLLLGLTGCATREDFGTTEIVEDALVGHLYLIPEGTPSLPDFTALRPVGKIYTTSLDIAPRDFKEGFPKVTDRLEWFGLQYTGVLRVRTPGTYTFGLNSDDGSRLYLGSRLVVDNDFQHDPLLKTGRVTLTAGEYPLKLTYFQGPRYEIALQFFITPPGGAAQIFDSTKTY